MTEINRYPTRHLSDSLKELPFNPDYREGALNAINTCLKVQPGEVMTVVTDEETIEIGASLFEASVKAGAIVTPYVIEDYSTRPMVNMPKPILEAIAKSQVALYAVQSQQGELPARKQFVNIIEQKQIRYAHMVMISPEIMLQGMRADYTVVDSIGSKIHSMVSACHTINCKTAAGTDIEATFDPDIKWIKTCGMITPQIWSNLPAGEVFTAPQNVNGIYVVDGTIGDYFSQKYGNLEEFPITLEIENNRLRSAHCDNKYLQTEFWRYVHLSENSDRIGEWAIGANIGVKKMIYNLLQDEKLPGMHIALGDPYGSQTGADWSAPTHVDAIAKNCNIWVDGNEIMRGGKFTFLAQ
ncbi:MAG: aminopeptidase [Chloroflexi bacterium]|uniref:Aminopeptidase n=1 Tax=Candidatus Chlorohelix allophototropha TaxID=3003348 RepID=A0A8T7M3R9_9CHLR|nr:aminopeptidase [Chloroflexota bacterium]WJW66100.1 aminopeptidase [Chloroflexota bacterium L227-S17]